KRCCRQGCRQLQARSVCSPGERCVKARLTRDRTQLFRNRFAFFALVNYESVIIAMSGPRSARHFAEIYKLPVGYVCFLQSKVIAHSRRNIEASAFVQIGLWAFVAK